DEVKRLALEQERPDFKAVVAAQQRQAQLLGVDFDQAREQMTPIDPAELDRLIRARGYRKDDDATEPATQTGAGRSGQDRGGDGGPPEGAGEAKEAPEQPAGERHADPS